MAIKNTTIRDMQKIKDKIIVFILYFLQTKDENYKKEALLHLENYAGFYNVPAKKTISDYG